MSCRPYRPTRHVEEWTFVPGSSLPYWAAVDGCTFTVVDGRPAIRHERRSGVQLYFHGDTIGRDPDGSVGFLSPRPVAGGEQATGKEG